MLAELLSLVDGTTLLLFGCLFVLSWWLLSVRGPGLPPGPLPVPLFGNLLAMAKGEMVEVLMEWNRKYGDIYSIYLGSRRVIAVCGRENIKELLTRTSDDFTDRPFMYEAHKASKGSKGVSMSNGVRWKESRRFALITMKDFGVGKQSLWERALEEAVALRQRLDESSGKVANLKPHFVTSVSNVICSVIFGRRFEFDDPEFNEVTEVLDSTLKRAGARSLINFMPWLRFVPFITKSLDNEIVAIETFVRRKIAEHRASFDPSQPPRDFVDLYLQVEHGQSDFDKDIFDEDHMYVLILDLFVGGTETTATTLLWGILYLVLNEDIQKRCREEIHALLGPDGLPAPEHRGQLPYVEATMLEVQRIGDIGPFIMRAATKDTTFKGYHLPKDANMLVLFHSINRDPARFPDPYEFRPERWLDEAGKIAPHDDFIPFSTGRRNCLGENLARMELFIFFVTLLHKFAFSTPEGQPPPSTQGHMGITRTPPEFEVLIHKVE